MLSGRQDADMLERGVQKGVFRNMSENERKN
jgi:Arc/MetJ-type ribon-helix-helix transcriptional regulator